MLPKTDGIILRQVETYVKQQNLRNITINLVIVKPGSKFKDLDVAYFITIF